VRRDLFVVVILTFFVQGLLFVCVACVLSVSGVDVYSRWWSKMVCSCMEMDGGGAMGLQVADRVSD
jgi:hypothetical protein